jgi:hypothetical protein
MNGKHLPQTQVRKHNSELKSQDGKGEAHLAFLEQLQTFMNCHDGKVMAIQERLRGKKRKIM